MTHHANSLQHKEYYQTPNSHNVHLNNYKLL